MGELGNFQNFMALDIPLASCCLHEALKDSLIH